MPFLLIQLELFSTLFHINCCLTQTVIQAFTCSLPSCVVQVCPSNNLFKHAVICVRSGECFTCDLIQLFWKVKDVAIRLINYSKSFDEVFVVCLPGCANWLQNHLLCPNDPRSEGVDDDDDFET